MRRRSPSFRPLLSGVLCSGGDGACSCPRIRHFRPLGALPPRVAGERGSEEQMTTSKEIVCLANSIKHGERCIAGIDRQTKEWVRPVSGRSDGAVTEAERQYFEGREPQLLDRMSVPLRCARPKGFQCENWLIDSSWDWVKLGRVGWDVLTELEEFPEDLWTAGYPECPHNDRVPVRYLSGSAGSLKLVRVDGLEIIRPSGSKPRVWAEFQYAGLRYKLSVTDPAWRRTVQPGVPRSEKVGESFLTVSLGEPFKEFSYKLVAAIMPRADVERGGRA